MGYEKNRRSSGLRLLPHGARLWERISSRLLLDRRLPHWILERTIVLCSIRLPLTYLQI